ncbi:hypothetical protein Q7C36_003754 [Tachysurus vachellii]|uniref:Uncharacterized protein n=1 Tax=Tachysurus vachellii TaxID=175792 RepID=A0AA88T9K9_TACVA|nr:hypothetical protein Q7C36_003754 [Tachysurus vachellii]
MFHPQPGLEEEQLSRDVKHNRDWRISLQALQWGYEQVKEEEEKEEEEGEGFQQTHLKLESSSTTKLLLYTYFKEIMM